MEVIKDEELWKIAKKRASFKKHFITYIIVIGFLWALWFITAGRDADKEDFYTAWPIWATLGWGIGLAFNYFDAYHDMNSSTAVQKEYDKLKNEGK